jgi:WD40 repeat protein
VSLADCKNYRLAGGTNDADVRKINFSIFYEKVIFWDIRKFQSYSEKIAAGSSDSIMCMESDGQHLFSGTYDEKIHLWDVPTGDLLTVTENSTSTEKINNF